VAPAAVAGSIAVPPSTPLVVTEGNYLLLDDEPWRQVRPLLDEAWFVAVDPALRVERLIARHVAHGRSPAAAMDWVLRSDEANAALVERTRESCSVAQLDGSDVVYVARVAVPKIVGLSVQIGTRFPALATSLGKVLLAALPPDELEAALAQPTRSGLAARWQPDRAERDAALREVRARGWALTDEQLALGIRSVAAPLRDGAGRVVAAINVNTHAAETPLERLLDGHLPLLLATAGEISADIARLEAAPHATVAI